MQVDVAQKNEKPTSCHPSDPQRLTGELFSAKFGRDVSAVRDARLFERPARPGTDVVGSGQWTKARGLINDVQLQPC